MPKQSTIVRCILCGHAIEVALAIGQMLKCPSCGTTFMAPDTTGDHAASEELAQPSGPRGDVDEADLPSPTPSSDGSPSAPTRSLPTLSIGQSPLDASSATPRSDRQPGEHPEEASGDLDEDERQPQGGWAFVGKALAVVIILAGVLLGIGLFLRHRGASDSDPSSSLAAVEPASDDAPSPPRINPDSPPFPVRYSPAAHRAQRLGGVRVRIARVRFAPLTAKTTSNEVIETRGTSFLQIELAVQNRTTRPVHYQSWYGNTFAWKHYDLTATFTDDRGRRWPLVLFDDAKAIRGHIAEAELEPGQEVGDLLVFEPPEDVDLADVQSWKLFLPGHAIGIDGGFGFAIDASGIEGWKGANTP